MQSANLLSELEQIPLRGEHERYTYENVVKQSGLMRNDLFAIEVAAGVEGALSSLLLDTQNVPDAADDAPDAIPNAIPDPVPNDLFDAYKLAFPDIAANHSLVERYMEMVNRGEGSVRGFINNIKGKLGELRIQEHLPQEFPPGYSFPMSAPQNQPIWDIPATSPDGTVTHIQVKIGGEDYAGEVLARMQENPNVLFAVSDEIRTKILTEHPELSDQFVNSNISNAALEGEVKEALAFLAYQNQPVWDILVTNPDGAVKPIQVKIGNEEYASEVLGRMQENPDVLFTVSSEIRAAVLAEHPELSDQFIDLDLSNLEFTSEVGENLDLIAENRGIDVPDEVGGFLPYITEIVLGIRLLLDIVNTERDFETVAINDKVRINAMKALVLFQRFGISLVLTTAGGALGSIVPILGNLGGVIMGAGLAAYLNSKLRPRLLEIGMKLAGVTEDDLFYFRNKVAIDRIGESFTKTAASI